MQMVREMLVTETGELRKETAAKDVEIAAAKEAEQTASTKAERLSSDLEKVKYVIIPFYFVC